MNHTLPRHVNRSFPAHSLARSLARSLGPAKSLCWFLSKACWSLWSDSMSNRALHRTCLVAVSHPRTSARNCKSSGVASLSSGCRAPVTFSIQLSPSACTFNNRIPTGFLRLPCVLACVLEVIHVWHRLHLTWTSESPVWTTVYSAFPQT